MKSDPAAEDLALLAARLGLGGSIAAHGAQKLFGMFGGPGLRAAGKSMAALGFHPGERYAGAAAAAELTAGALIAAGALGPVGPAMLHSIMLVALESAHRKNGYFQSKNGFELNAMYLIGALLLASQGHGRISFDRATGLGKRFGASLGLAAIGGGILAAVAVLAQRSIPAPDTHTIRVEWGSTESAPTL